MLNHGFPQTVTVGESLGRDDQFGGVIVPLPTPEEMNTPGVQEALTSAQKVASFLASYGNPFDDPPPGPSIDRGGQPSGKATIFHPIIDDRVSLLLH